MKKTLVKSGLLAMISLAFLGVTLGTVSWFTSLVVIDNTYNTNTKIDGSTMGAYFAYGNGIPTGEGNRVYGINKPRHLYNLAWLQYLGFFDKADGTQYYFEIDPNLQGELDMTGWTLPPIGTKDHPFTGNFNGNGKVISNLNVSSEFGDFNTHPSDITESNYVQPDIVGFFGVVGNYNNVGTYETSANTISTLGLKDLTVESNSATTLVGLAAGYVDATIENVAIQNPTLVVSNQSASNLSDAITENISDYLAIGYCKDTNDKRYTADISKVTNNIYNVNVTQLTPFTITEQGSSTGWGGSIDMLEMYNNLDTDWKKLKHGYTSGTTIDPLSYDSARTDTYDEDGSFIGSNVTGTTQNDMPYNDYGQITATGDSNHKYYNVSKNSSLTNEDTEVSENLQTSSVSYVVQTQDTTQADEERFMCLTGKKDIPITNGLTVTTNHYPTLSGKYIQSGNYYLTVNNNTIVNNSTTQTTCWVFSNGKLFTDNGSNQKLYLACANNGTLSLTTNVNNATNWTHDTTSNTIFATVDGNIMLLVYDNNAWKGQAYTIDHYLIHDAAGHYIRHNGTANVTISNSTTYCVTDPNKTNTNLWWYKNGNYFRTTSGGGYYLLRYNTNSLRVRNSTSNRMAFDGEYFSNGGYYIYNNGSTYSLSTTQKTAMYLEPVFSTTPPTVNYTGSSSIKVYSSDVTTENATLSIPHTFFPLRYAENSGVPDQKNTGYVVSGGNYFDDPYGDIRVSAYSISSYLNGVSTSDSTDSQSKKYKSINTVYTKQFNTSTGAINNTDANAETVYANSEKYTKSKEALQYVFGGQSNAYGLHFMNATISDSDPAVVEGALINGSIYKNLELPTDCVDFHLKEKGVINFFAGSYYTNNRSFFSLYEIDREAPVSTANISGSETAVTLTYDGIDSSYKMKFTYDNDPFNVSGHTFDHVTINGNIRDEEGNPFNITNYPGNSNKYFTLDKGLYKFEYFNLKFYDSLGTCYLDIDVTTQRTKINEIRRITRVWSDPSDTDGKKSYCYQYDINGNTRYSVPYMYVTGRKVDLDGSTPYVEGRVTDSKPSAFTKMEFSTQCIEVGPHGGSLSYTTSGRTQKGYIYYFEVPMNEGEFALGSVSGYNGAYLMYLDIAANASLVKRTTITEHFTSSEAKFKYPLGVAIVTDAATALSNIQTTPINPTDSVFVTLDDSFRGVINVDLAVISTVKTATLIRANTANAPNGYSAGDHASIGYVADDITIANGTKTMNIEGTEQSYTGSGSLASTPLSTVSRETKRVNFYDFTTTEGTTWTQISETWVDGVSEGRTVVQEENDVEVAESKIKIYGSDGKSTTKDDIDFSALTFDSSTVVLQFYYVTEDYEEVTTTIELSVEIGSENYYEYLGYVVAIENTGDAITVKILQVGTGTITVNGHTPAVNDTYQVPEP